MTALMTGPPGLRADPTVVAAVEGDDVAFAALVARHRRELHGHCWRILNSFDQAEDAVQETLLRAWRGRDRFAGRAQFRTWLYQIATNACMDEIDRRRRRPLIADDGTDVVIDPDEPDQAVLTKEALELAFGAALRVLTPRQRAALVLCDALRWSAAETAELLGTTVASVNSALQRARASLAEHRLGLEPAMASRGALAGDERELLIRYVDAVGRADVAAVVRVVCADAGFVPVAA